MTSPIFRNGFIPVGPCLVSQRFVASASGNPQKLTQLIYRSDVPLPVFNTLVRLPYVRHYGKLLYSLRIVYAIAVTMLQFLTAVRNSV